VVIGDDVGRNGLAATGRDRHRIGFQDHMADRYDQPVRVDDDAIAVALPAQGHRRTRIRRNFRLQQDDGAKHGFDGWRVRGGSRMGRHDQQEGGKNRAGVFHSVRS
jgi:hypothetical protein